MTTATPTGGATPPLWTPRPISVLLIDDQAIIGQAIKKLLESETEIVFQHCSESGQAIATAVQVAPTVILLDLVMPDIDGMTLLKFLRGNRKTREIPILILTTKEDPKIRAEAFTLGATDFLMKLPEKTELLTKIRTFSQGYLAQAQRDELNAQLTALKAAPK